MSTFTRPGQALHVWLLQAGETLGAEVTFEVMEWQELMRVEIESHDAIVVKDRPVGWTCRLDLSVGPVGYLGMSENVGLIFPMK